MCPCLSDYICIFLGSCVLKKDTLALWFSLIAVTVTPAQRMTLVRMCQWGRAMGCADPSTLRWDPMGITHAMASPCTRERGDAEKRAASIGLQRGGQWALRLLRCLARSNYKTLVNPLFRTLENGKSE